MPEALRRLERVGVVGLCCSTFCLLVFVGASVVGVQFINYDAGVRLRMLTLQHERTNARTHERTNGRQHTHPFLLTLLDPDHVGCDCHRVQLLYDGTAGRLVESKNVILG